LSLNPAAEPKIHRLGNSGHEPPSPNQTVRATGKKAEIAPSPVQWMFGGGNQSTLYIAQI
ncbi:hypothetical protein KC640_03010, partial [Candidatus Dojkabacteria bacterium]|nr:hypothetical protein [Candidatus Dojkabacteria bacterium]